MINTIASHLYYRLAKALLNQIRARKARRQVRHWRRDMLRAMRQRSRE